MLLTYRLLAVLIPLLHLLFIGWEIFGALFTRRRPLLAALHIASFIYGVAIEILPYGCPLTQAEDWARRHAGLAPYPGDFLSHYLELLIYPQVDYHGLIISALVVAALNFAIYLGRWRRRELAR